MKKPQFLFASRFFATSSSSRKSKKLRSWPLLWPCPGVSAPPAFTGNEYAITKKLFNVKSKLITVMSSEDEPPEWKIPEVAFAGRSNVGKSSLINAITQQENLVRISKTPGRTQLLHFYSLGGKPGGMPYGSMVDMPGYGFAKAPEAEIKRWNELLGHYINIRKSQNLKNIFLLIDAKVGLKPLDHEFMDFLEDMGAIYQIVLTKIDCVTFDVIRERIQQIHEISKQENRFMMNPVVHLASSKEKIGIRELQMQIISLTGLFLTRKQWK